MAVLILGAVILMQAVGFVSFFLIRFLEGEQNPPQGPVEIASLIQLVAAAPAGAERAAVLAQIAHAFPELALSPGAEDLMPDAASDGPPPTERFLKDRLGPSYNVFRSPTSPQQIVIRLPDGAVLSVHVPPRTGLPPPGPPTRTFIGPLIFTVLFMVITTTLLLLWAARALRTPLSGFAAAAESFSLESDVTALPEQGPEEVRAVARAFNRMRDRIRKLVDDRTRMLAAMGHDLRTPITRLRLRSEFIADDELRRQVLRDLDQMKAMTEGVLSFLRDGHAHGTKTTVDLASVLQTVCDEYADMGHAVSYAGPDHATVLARPDDLQRAVTNLVDNAVRHGTATVVRLTVTPARTTIDVEDDGPGIPDERKAAMLEAFVRGEEARTMDDRSGFGLGLSIARAIAEGHGGSLSLHDRAPHGLIARITLPA